MINIQQNIPLASLTTFGIGGDAKFFVEVRSVDELAEAVKFAKDNGLPVFVLGGGSNILISDNGFNGLIIKMNIRGLWIIDFASRLSTGVVLTVGAGPAPEKAESSGSSKLLLRCGAGEMWDDVVAKAVELGVGGIENLSLIPGTVGGAVYQNIGAYGAELKDVLVSVKAYDAKTDNVVELSNKECGFEYRSSVFKKNKNLIVLEADLLLSKNQKLNLLYPDLQKRFAGASPTISEVRQAVIEIRRSKIPDPEKISNAGSFFKNPVVTTANFQRLTTNCSDLKGRDLGGGSVKLSAAQLIEMAGFKGKKVGNVGVSEKHALVLINYGNGTAKELTDLAGTVKEAVKAQFGVKLEPEVEQI